jgi:hypothetical protein
VSSGSPDRAIYVFRDFEELLFFKSPYFFRSAKRGISTALSRFHAYDLFFFARFKPCCDLVVVLESYSCPIYVLLFCFFFPSGVVVPDSLEAEWKT